MDEDDFEKTLIWVEEEEKLRITRGQGVGTFYLVVLSIILFVITFLILYFSNRNKKMNALEMMKDPNNVYDNDDVSESEYEEEVPLIDLSDENIQQTDEPEMEKVVEPVK